MVTEVELLAAVGEEFEETGRGLVVWPDPHAGRSPRDELDQLDDAVLAVVRGTFRRLSSGDRQVIVLGDGRWNATDVTSIDVPALLAGPGTGWAEVSGRPWLT